jgi:SAM-dependent methyltransferase
MERQFTSWIRRNVLDSVLPPVVRDRRAMNAVANRMWTGKVPLDFQREAWSYTADDWAAVYRAVSRARVAKRVSDTSVAEVEWLCERVSSLRPSSVLDVGAGRGYVAGRVLEVLPSGSRLYVADAFEQARLPATSDGRTVTVLKATGDDLPFADQQIDVLICAHTLEHLTNLFSTFRELRRVAKRLLIIVPLQRWAPYTWDTHLHFFPYLEYLPGLLEMPAADARVIDGDGCYEFVS